MQGRVGPGRQGQGGARSPSSPGAAAFGPVSGRAVAARLMDWLGSVTEAVGNGWNAAGESLSTAGDGVKSVIPREVTIGFIKVQVVQDGDDSGGRTARNRYDSAVTGSTAAAAAGA